MKKTLTINKTICDLCGKEHADCLVASESCSSAPTKLVIDVWYGGTLTYTDFCRDCQRKLNTLLNDNFKNMIGQKQ
jgi:thymidine kinase